MNLPKIITINDVRNARKQADCGGHFSISIEQYTQHIDCLLAEIDRRDAMAEPKQCRDINKLKPALKAKVLSILAALKHEGYHPFVIETLRTAERQAWLIKGKHTWVKHSRHQDGAACDIGFKDASGAAVWSGDFAGWDRLAHYAREQGLVAGHDWTKRDCPHVEMKK